MGWVVLVVAILLLLVAADLLFGKALLARMRGDNIDPGEHAKLRLSRSHLRGYTEDK